MPSRFSCGGKLGDLWSSRHVVTAFVPATFESILRAPAAQPLQLTVEGQDAQGYTPRPDHTRPEWGDADPRASWLSIQSSVPYREVEMVTEA